MSIEQPYSLLLRDYDGQLTPLKETDAPGNSMTGDPEQPRETIFFLETSDRDTIGDRAACAIESAVRSLGLRVIYLMKTR